MQGNPRDVITAAERRFPVRIGIGVPPEGPALITSDPYGFLTDDLLATHCAEVS